VVPSVKTRKFPAGLKVSIVFFSLLLSAFLPTAIAAENYQLAPFKVSYLLERGNITVGIGDYELKTDGTNYLYTSEARAKGFLATILLGDTVISEQAAGIILANGTLQPNSFNYFQGEKNKRNQNIRFNWKTNSATAEYKFKSKNVPLRAGVLDRLSMQLAAMRAVAEDPRDGTLSYSVVERGDLNDYDFKVTGRQSLVIDGQNYNTVVLERQASDREATFWVAPSLGYAIVKFEQQKEDDPVVRLTLRSITGKPLVKQ